MYKKRCIARYIHTVYQKKKTPLPGSLSLSNVYTSHLEGGLRLALYDSLFIWGVLAYRALWRYNPHYTRLIPPPNVSARYHHRQGKTEESNRGYLQGIYGSNTSFQDDNQLLPRLRFHISSPWRTCFLFFCLGEKKRSSLARKKIGTKGHTFLAIRYRKKFPIHWAPIFRLNACAAQRELETFTIWLEDRYILSG